MGNTMPGKKVRQYLSCRARLHLVNPFYLHYNGILRTLDSSFSMLVLCKHLYDLPGIGSLTLTYLFTGWLPIEQSFSTGFQPDSIHRQTWNHTCFQMLLGVLPIGTAEPQDTIKKLEPTG